VKLLPEGTEIRVWDSTAETRYLVLPMRPAGTEGWSEEQLAELVTRDSMIGTGLPKRPRGRLMDGAHDMGGMDGFGQVEPEPNEPVFHAEWERRAFAITRDGDARRLEHRHVALCARGSSAAGLSQQELLPDLARRARAADADRAQGLISRTRSRPAMRCIRQSRWRGR
jgi:hypothetical protein